MDLWRSIKYACWIQKLCMRKGSLEIVTLEKFFQNITFKIGFKMDRRSFWTVQTFQVSLLLTHVSNAPFSLTLFFSLRFSNIFRGKRKGALETNGLTKQTLVNAPKWN